MATRFQHSRCEIDLPIARQIYAGNKGLPHCMIRVAFPNASSLPPYVLQAASATRDTPCTRRLAVASSERFKGAEQAGLKLCWAHRRFTFFPGYPCQSLFSTFYTVARPSATRATAFRPHYGEGGRRVQRGYGSGIRRSWTAETDGRSNPEAHRGANRGQGRGTVVECTAFQPLYTSPPRASITEGEERAMGERATKAPRCRDARGSKVSVRVSSSPFVDDSGSPDVCPKSGNA